MFTMKMSEILPEKTERLHQTTISTSSYVITRLWNLKHLLGPRPESERMKGQMHSYNNTEIMIMALDALEEKLKQKE